MSVSEVSPSQPGSGHARLPLVCLQGSVGVLSLRLSVVVLSLWLVWTLGVGEGCSYSEAKVEVRVYCDPTSGEQV